MSEREAVLYFVNVAKVKVGGFDDGGVKMVSRMMPRLHAGPEGVTIVSSMMREVGPYFFGGESSTNELEFRLVLFEFETMVSLPGFYQMQFSLWASGGL